MKKSQAAAQSGSMAYQLKTTGIASLLGAGVIGLMLCAAAGLMSARDISPSMVTPLSLAAMVADGLAGGLICGRMLRSHGMLFGLACGGAIFLLMFLLELAVVNGGYSVLTLYKLALYAASGMMGGIIGVNKKNAPKKPTVAKKPKSKHR